MKLIKIILKNIFIKEKLIIFKLIKNKKNEINKILITPDSQNKEVNYIIKRIIIPIKDRKNNNNINKISPIKNINSQKKKLKT